MHQSTAMAPPGDSGDDSDEPVPSGQGLEAYEAVVLAGGSATLALKGRVAMGMPTIADPGPPTADESSGDESDDGAGSDDADADAGDQASVAANANPNDAAEGNPAPSDNPDATDGSGTATDDAGDASDSKGEVDGGAAEPTTSPPSGGEGDGGSTSDASSVASGFSERGLRQASVAGKPFLTQRVSEILGWYNDNTVPTLASLGQPRASAMPLVLFEEAVSHVCRVVRLLRMPGRHAMLMGVGGSGKRSVTKLAAFAAARYVVHLADSRPAQDGEASPALRAHV